MDISQIIGLLALLVTAVSGAGLIWYFLPSSKRTSNLGAPRGQEPINDRGANRGVGNGRNQPTPEMLEELKRRRQKKRAKAELVELDDRFFQAGMFSAEDKRSYFLLRTFAPIVFAPLAGIIGSNSSITLGIMGAIIGAAFGLRLPSMLLDRKIAARQEDILFYLPLVIEQIVIGVSSSLDVGPCLQRVVSMADERDTHNCVTELLSIAQLQITMGVSLQEALVDVGRRSGHTELKHTFMSLSQVASHGGEVTRQLQELADAVASQREAKIEAKIKKLELEATVPVAVVFCGFLIIIISGFGIQIQGTLK
ncbi:MAG: type II secretion system F family protein [Proteobacteria bacterium]|nr:type II secretion system F family protein [Pseudomonadota bacterium]